MLSIITDKPQWVCEWVAKRLPGFEGTDFQPCSTLAFLRDGRMLAGVIFNNFRPQSRDVHLTIAADSPRWVSRKALKIIFEYVFIQLGCIRLTVVVSKRNKRARKLAEGLGFQYEGKQRKGFDGIEDAVCYGMLSDECGWIGEKSCLKAHLQHQTL